MRQHHFVAVYGPRNSGKTRICQALKQSLETEVRNMREIERRYKAKAGMKWKVAYIRLNRDENPFDLLTRAIAGPFNNILIGAGEKVDPLFESSIKAALMEPDGNGLLKIYKQFLQIKQYNFLVVVDQFENLFFTTVLNQEDKHKFVRLLLNASYMMRQMYVTIAIRPPKADLWKLNFKNLSSAVTSCRYRVYNPNQAELEVAIRDAFVQEQSKLLEEVGDEDLLQADWLEKQEIYQEVAVKRIRAMSQGMFKFLRERWRSLYQDSNPPKGGMIPMDEVQKATHKLRGIVDVIWPQLLLNSNIGALDEEERADLVEDLKDQLTEVMTSELLMRLSRLLAEDLYFEKEPLPQIEKHVRQLARDWSQVLKDMRHEGGRRKRKVVTITMEEQRANTVGAATFDFKIDRDAPMDERAEAAYMALRTPLDKRIAVKILTVLGRLSKTAGTSSNLTIDSLGHAIGRFENQLVDVVAVFAHAGVIFSDPPGDLTMTSSITLESSELVDRWSRLQEWVYGKKSESESSGAGGGNGHVAEIQPVSLELIEDFGEVPAEAAEFANRAEAIYSSIAPPSRKRAARYLLTQLAVMGQEGDAVNPNELISSVGRFESQIREVMEYFIRQGIIKPEGGLRYSEPSLPSQWGRLKEWVKTA